MGAKSTAVVKFHGASENDVIARIESGKSISQVASEFAVNRSTLWRWIESDPQRSARARDARQASAEAWDDKAAAVIERAEDTFELARARELAQHYRWRASKIAPGVYGDRVTHAGDSDNPIAFTLIERAIVDPR